MSTLVKIKVNKGNMNECNSIHCTAMAEFTFYEKIYESKVEHCIPLIYTIKLLFS